MQAALSKIDHVFCQHEGNCRMKEILFLGDCLDMGGIGRAFTTLAEALERSGVRVKVVAMYKHDIPRLLPAAQTRLVGYVWRYQITNRWIGKALRLLNWMTCWRLYFLFAKKYQHDVFVVYAANIDPQWCWYSKKHCIGWLHGMSIIGFDRMSKWLRIFMKRRMRCALERYDKLFAVSPATASYWNDLVSLSIIPSVVYNISNTEEITRLSKCAQTEIRNNNQPNLLTVARLSSEKGIGRLLEVYQRLLNEGFRFKAYIVGDGSQRAEIEKMISDLGLCEIVHLLGEKKNPYPYMIASDLLICSSYVEGLSMVLSEALCLGCPVISTDCGGHRDLLREGKWGCIVENSIEGLYNGLKGFLNDPHSVMPKVSFDGVREEIEKVDKATIAMLKEMFNAL